MLDPQGAPVRSVTVTVTGQGNGVTRTVATDADGLFVVSNLPPGTVDLAAVAAGFNDILRKDMVLDVGRTVSLDLNLSIGIVRETVNVGSPLGVDTSRSVVDAVIPTSLIDALPLNGRNFLELALLVPGNTPAPNFDPTKTNSVTISSAGQLGRGGNIMIDGADNNDDVVGGTPVSRTYWCATARSRKIPATCGRRSSAAPSRPRAECSGLAGRGRCSWRRG